VSDVRMGRFRFGGCRHTRFRLWWGLAGCGFGSGLWVYSDMC